ncbi:uncharacterized protein LOC115973680 [Quercus lobata]|uniref:uncharacterized protein LOC115973680 n=1 Tax=Quercus lobata TaxID=97700 RepID=UPI0012460FDB|nr:uncharacterized protein LOC115973680 [Quercus lobata]
MAVHSKNETLLCKVFPSSLGPVAKRWFDGLKAGSINSFKELTRMYWEMFNKIDGDFEDVAISTFKLSLPAEHGLRKSLTGKPVTRIRQLMVNAVFREPVHQVSEKIKNKLYSKWPNKMSGDPLRHNQSLHFQCHQDWGHTTEDCRTLWNHLEQLVKKGKLQQFLHQPNV